MKPNPRYDEVLDALQSGKSDLCGSWVGDCWRYQAITHPSGRDILSGKGAFSNGGRWNAPGAFPVVYGSTTASVALAESEANDRYFGIVCRKARLHVCIGMSFSRVLDLTAAPVLRKLGLKTRDLQAEDWRKINGERMKASRNALGALRARWVWRLCCPRPPASREASISPFSPVTKPAPARCFCMMKTGSRRCSAAGGHKTACKFAVRIAGLDVIHPP